MATNVQDKVTLWGCIMADGERIVEPKTQFTLADDPRKPGDWTPITTRSDGTFLLDVPKSQVKRLKFKFETVPGKMTKVVVQPFEQPQRKKVNIKAPAAPAARLTVSGQIYRSAAGFLADRASDLGEETFLPGREHGVGAEDVGSLISIAEAQMSGGAFVTPVKDLAKAAGLTASVANVAQAEAVIPDIIETLEDSNIIEPYAGLAVELRNADGDVVATTSTDAEGEFSFAIAEEGHYEIHLPRSQRSGGTVYRLSDALTVLGVDIAANTPAVMLPAFVPLIYTVAMGTVSGVVTDGAVGIPGIAVTLTQTIDGQTYSTSFLTDTDGEYEFEQVPPGPATVTFPSPVTAVGRSWELAGGPTDRTVTITAGEVVRVPRVVYSYEVHGISHSVTDSDGEPIEGVLVEVYDHDPGNGRAVAQGFTDQNGRVRFEVPSAGEYDVYTYPPSMPDNPIIKTVRCNSEVSSAATVPSGSATTRTGGFGRAGGSNGGGTPVTANVDNSYPLLTQSISPTQAGGPSQSFLGGQGSVGDAASRAIGQVLGWKPRSNDTNGFTNALKQRFDLREFEGHVEWEYKPGNYLLQTDLSADRPITGAQASLLAQMKNATDKSKSLLDGLTTLRVDADPEDSDAIKQLIRSQMARLTEEMGLPGGPRISRTDEIFDQLMGPLQGTGGVSADDVHGSLGNLRDEFGLAFRGTNNLVNTVEDEEIQTQFRIMVDYLSSVRVSWQTNKPFFNRTSDAQFFGTQLVHLSRQLSVINAEVEQVRMIFDSVFMDHAERLTTRISFPNANTSSLRIGPTDSIRTSAGKDTRQGLAIYDDTTVVEPGQDGLSMSVEDVLSWVQQFAGTEGPRTIEDGGKFGVRSSFLPEAVKLRNLVYAATDTTGPGYGGMPPAYRSSRVQGALRGLAAQIDEVAALAVSLTHPIPSQGVAGSRSSQNGTYPNGTHSNGTVVAAANVAIPRGAAVSAARTK